MGSTWRAALRIARRDALRARGRSALIVAMIALPVLAPTVGVVLLRTYELDPKEQLTRRIGAADAAYRVVTDGRPIVQAPDGRTSRLAPSSGDGAGQASAQSRGDKRQQATPPEVVPAGSRTITERRATARVQARDVLHTAQYRELDYTDPIADGIIAERDGRAPRTRDEAAVTAKMQEALDLTLGDRVKVTLDRGYRNRSAEQHTKSFRVVGVVTDRANAPNQQVVALPGAFPADALPQSGPRVTWLADTPAPVTWREIQVANEWGVVVVSRAVALDPPPRAVVPFHQSARSGSNYAGQAITTSVLIFGMGTLEVILLAGAAFAVGARRQSRQLALVAASGGDARHVRRVVLGSGVALGTAGAFAGVALGIGLAAAALPFARMWVLGGVPGHFDVRALELAGIGLFGAVTGVFAAVVPARGAARQNVITALTGRRGIVATKRRYPAIGFALFLLGAAGTVAGTVMRSAVVVTAGAVFSQIGLVIAAPALVGAASRLGRSLPAMPRIALRDASRNRSRAAPAMAAVMAAVAAACAVLVYLQSSEDQWKRTYVPQAQHGQATLALPAYASAERRATLRQAVRTELPVSGVTALRRPAGDARDESAPDGMGFVPPPSQRCPVGEADESSLSLEQLQRIRAEDPRCQDTYERSLYGIVVGDAGTIRSLTGKASAAARRTLAGGGVVVFDRDLIGDGSAFAEIYFEERSKVRRLPATYLEVSGVTPTAVLSRDAARDLGFQLKVSRLVFHTTRMPTADEEARAAAELQELTGQAGLYVERGYTSELELQVLILLLVCAVVTLGASGIATGLALADGRTDQATLGAIGASPWIRRSFAAFQAGTISWLGTGLGIIAGLVPGTAIVLAQRDMRVALPWADLAVLLVAVPLLAMLAALVFTRSRLPLTRRIE